MDKVTSISDILSKIQNGATIMVGGFASFGRPNSILTALRSTNLKDLTLISNCTSLPDTPLGKLVSRKFFKKIIVSHIGANPDTQALVAQSELDLELVPQGTLVERIRSGGNGLGGILTKTGLGTEVAENKRIVNIDGQAYLLERPLKADIALIKCAKADRMGNLQYYGTAFSHSVQMATAAKITIVEADEIVETGTIEPNAVHTQSVYVDYIIEGASIK